MKAQRRHALQQNILDAELAKGIEFLKQYRTPIVWGVFLVALAVLLVTYGLHSVRTKREAVQAKFDRLIMSTAVTPQEFLDGMKSLAESDSKTLAAIATVHVAKYYLAQFSTAGGDAADPQLKNLADQAAAYFRRAIQNFPDQRTTVAEAHLGLARLAEGEGDFATAAKEYQAVTSMADLVGEPAAEEAKGALLQLDFIKTPVRMATTSSAPASEPAAAK